MEHIFTENQYGVLYEESNDDPNEIRNDDLIKLGDIITLMIKIC